MTQEQINEIKARCEAATPEPWCVMNSSIPNKKCVWSEAKRAYENQYDVATILTLNDNDSEFIAHAREDIPQLIEFIEQLLAENAELRARLEKSVELPCKVGDKLYFINLYHREIYKEAYVDGIGIYWTNKEDIGDYIPPSVIGKTVFLTREEAEKALKNADAVCTRNNPTLCKSSNNGYCATESGGCVFKQNIKEREENEK